MNKALLVIDVQEDYTGNTANKDPFPVKDNHQLIDRINGYIEEYHTKQYPVLLIAQIIPNNWFGRTVFGVSLKGTEGAKIDKRVLMVQHYYFEKLFPNSFSNRTLVKWVKENNISSVDLVGIDATQCVAATAKGGAKLGLQVQILCDATATFRPSNIEKTFQKLRKQGITLTNEHNVLT
jgi:nicotinamidase-related amidase